MSADSPVQIAQLSPTELIDYLHTAVTEGDTLFVTYWLEQLRLRRVANPSTSPHSWKVTTPLEQAVTGTPSPSRKLILQCLLARTPHDLSSDSVKIRHVLGRAQNWARDTVKAWFQDETNSVAKGRALLDMSPEAAERWITDNLAPHPNPDSLTGFSTLPTRPASHLLRKPILSRPHRPRGSDTLSSDHAPHLEHSRPPFFQPTPVQLRRHDDPLCRVYIALNGSNATDAEIETLLASTRVPILDCRILRSRVGDRNKVNVLFRVASRSDMDLVIRAIDGTSLAGNSIFVQRAIAERRDLLHFHLLIPDAPRHFGPLDLHRLVRASRCGPFDTQVGHDSRGNWLGVSRVESREAVIEATEWLRDRGYPGTTWARDPPPRLHAAAPVCAVAQDQKPNVSERHRSPSSSSTSAASSATSSHLFPRLIGSSLSPAPTDSPGPPEPSPYAPSYRSESLTPNSPRRAYSTELPIDTSFTFTATAAFPLPPPRVYSYSERFRPIDFSWNQPALDEARDGRLRSERAKKRTRHE
ncbi:hypothetical protein JCM11491_003673 [Sporobolomyces phaffii]